MNDYLIFFGMWEGVGKAVCYNQKFFLLVPISNVETFPMKTAGVFHWLLLPLDFCITGLRTLITFLSLPWSIAACKFIRLPPKPWPTCSVRTYNKWQQRVCYKAGCTTFAYDLSITWYFAGNLKKIINTSGIRWYIAINYSSGEDGRRSFIQPVLWWCLERSRKAWWNCKYSNVEVHTC